MPSSLPSKRVNLVKEKRCPTRGKNPHQKKGKKLYPYCRKEPNQFYLLWRGFTGTAETGTKAAFTFPVGGLEGRGDRRLLVTANTFLSGREDIVRGGGKKQRGASQGLEERKKEEVATP